MKDIINDNQLSRTSPALDIAQKIKKILFLIWQRKKIFIKINITVLILSIIILLFVIKPYYKSTVVILPDYGNQVSSLLGQFAGLASLGGVNLGEQAPTEIYQSLLKSQAVMKNVIYRKYKTAEYDSMVTLIEYFEIDPDNRIEPDLQSHGMFLEMYQSMVKKRVNTSIDRITKALTIEVTMPEALLSADVANEIADNLNNYILSQRKSLAIEQRKYIEKRIKEVVDSLTLDEERLKDFKLKNRLVNQSPQLILEQSRLVRSVEIKNAVYMELMKQFEIAKIEEVKDTPVINLIEKASNPIKKEGPMRTIILMLIMTISVLLSSYYIIYNEYIIEFIHNILNVNQ